MITEMQFQKVMAELGVLTTAIHWNNIIYVH